MAAHASVEILAISVQDYTEVYLCCLQVCPGGWSPGIFLSESLGKKSFEWSVADKSLSGVSLTETRWWENEKQWWTTHTEHLAIKWSREIKQHLGENVEAKSFFFFKIRAIVACLYVDRNDSVMRDKIWSERGCVLRAGKSLSLGETDLIHRWRGSFVLECQCFLH